MATYSDDDEPMVSLRPSQRSTHPIPLTIDDDDDVQYIGPKHGEGGESGKGRRLEPYSSGIGSQYGAIWTGRNFHDLPPRALHQANSKAQMYADSAISFYRTVAGYAGLKMHEVLEAPVGILHPQDLISVPPIPPEVKHDPEPKKSLQMDPWREAFMSLVDTMSARSGKEGGFDDRRRMAMWLTQPEVSGRAFLSTEVLAHTDDALVSVRQESNLNDLEFNDVAIDASLEIRTLFAKYIGNAIQLSRNTAELEKNQRRTLQQSARTNSEAIRQIKAQFQRIDRAQSGQLVLCSRQEALNRRRDRMYAIVDSLSAPLNTTPVYGVVPLSLYT